MPEHTQMKTAVAALYLQIEGTTMPFEIAVGALEK
jgi:hypothetical protein